MKFKAAVLGHPVSQSLSPDLFKFLAQKNSLALDYIAIDVLPEALSGLLKEMAKTFVGVNVTIPHKEKVTSDLDHSAPEAQALGAVNVLHFKDGKALGFNTDVHGILQTLKFHDLDLAGKDIHILGAGGAARAAAFAFGTCKVQSVTFSTRNPEKAQSMIHSMKTLFPKVGWQVGEAREFFHLTVNATPLGMLDKTETGFFERALENAQAKDERGAVFDMVYRPLETAFLKLARSQGLQAIGGLDMLIFQALATWSIWFGKISEADEAKLHHDLRIFLTEKLLRHG